MKSIRALTLTVLLFAVLSARAQLTPMTPEGCFSSSEPMQDQGSYMYQSTGYCQQLCAGLGKAVMATTAGSNCWCGDLLPAASSKVTEDTCNSPCNGYNKQNCIRFCPPGNTSDANLMLQVVVQMHGRLH